jgi:tRNA(Ile2) C34 agmatinyltransferase TiaS
MVYNRQRSVTIKEGDQKMAEKRIEKFKKQPEINGEEILEMELISYEFLIGGEGICPECGGKMSGEGIVWKCNGCDLQLMGPIV